MFFNKKIKATNSNITIITKQPKFTPWWVTGFTDAEGNFSINYNSVTNKVTFSYKVTQKHQSMLVLIGIKNYFNSGNINIDNRKNEAFKFVVSNKSDLINKVIPHFDKYPLVGSKHLDYLSFKKALLSTVDSTNIDLILSIKKNMNKRRSYEERWTYLSKKSFELQPEWVQAFIDGEGSFQCGISNMKKTMKIDPTLEIAQSSHDAKVLEAIKNYLSAGYLKPKYDINSLSESMKKRSVIRLIINQHEEVIKFFEKYNLYTTKWADYRDWKKVIESKLDKLHLTDSGKDNIIKIKERMNRSRFSNCRLFSFDDKLKLYNLVNKRSYSTSNNNNKFNNEDTYLKYILLFTLISFVLLYLLDFGLIYLLETYLWISFFYLLTTWYLDNYKLSDNKYIRISQKIIFVLFIVYLIINIIELPVAYAATGDEAPDKIVDKAVEALDKGDITLKGKVVLDKKAGAEVAKGISMVGSNIGLGACVGTIASGVSKAIASSPMPPARKAGFVILGGLSGAAIHSGASAINAKRAADNNNKPSDGNIKSDSPESYLDYFPSGEDTRYFLENLVWSISILNLVSLLLFIILITQYLFRYYVSDEPKLIFLDKVLPKYSNTIKSYIYKYIKLRKTTDKYSTLFVSILLFICLFFSFAYSSILYSDLQSYVDYYVNTK